MKLCDLSVHTRSIDISEVLWTREFLQADNHAILHKQTLFGCYDVPS